MIGLAMFVLTLIFGGGTLYAFKFRSMLMNAIQPRSERVQHSMMRNPAVRHAMRLGTRGVLNLIKEWAPSVGSVGSMLGLWQVWRGRREVNEGLRRVESELEEVERDVERIGALSGERGPGASLGGAPNYQALQGGDKGEVLELIEVEPGVWAYPGIEFAPERGAVSAGTRPGPEVQVRPPWATGGRGGEPIPLPGAPPEVVGGRGTVPAASTKDSGAASATPPGKEKAPVRHAVLGGTAGAEIPRGVAPDDVVREATAPGAQEPAGVPEVPDAAGAERTDRAGTGEAAGVPGKVGGTAEEAKHRGVPPGRPVPAGVRTPTYVQHQTRVVPQQDVGVLPHGSRAWGPVDLTVRPDSRKEDRAAPGARETGTGADSTAMSGAVGTGESRAGGGVIPEIMQHASRKDKAPEMLRPEKPKDHAGNFDGQN